MQLFSGLKIYHLNKIMNKTFLRRSKTIGFWIRFRHKASAELRDENNPKISQDVLKFLYNNDDYKDLIDRIPKNLLKRYKTPETMYMINKKSAKLICDTVKCHFDKNAPIVEVNPGFGFLTEEILQCQENPVYLYEHAKYFDPFLCELQKKYPGRINYKIADFFGMWKLAFMDKMDEGTRIQELLGDLASQSPSKTLKILGAMPGLSFVKHLINTIVFHNTTNEIGHPDLFIIMPGHHYEMDDHFLYLVNITQKEKLPCPPEYLPLLWYYFKPQTFSKTTRVIPMLEQWIPGCGVWLITGQDPPDTIQHIVSSNDAALPHMTIFTEFGDLSLQQKLTLFKRFVSWPEFEQCPFRSTMESNLPKFATHLNDDEDKSEAHFEELENSDSENEPENL
ncbi:dimethyladenosine transferase 2, mitochondrial isoform X2 [Leptidea sinapis]|uniref:dimethyladenosine transferase 2, mitochondrial isoform X2 n=1 Tax=Leptidea sinapis TaxID=189913 RepID=UPI00211F86CD|nr:dimethyladenosine transferase 2, mitochondrial isoform X2 [Leptidea sinapis]